MKIGTMENPVMVRSAGDEQYAGCTGVPADSHNVIWLGVGHLSTATLVHADPCRCPRSAPSSGAPSAAASTRWSMLAPRTTAITTTTTVTRSPRRLSTLSSPSTVTNEWVRLGSSMTGGEWGLVEYWAEELYRFPRPVPVPPRPVAYCRVPAHPRTSTAWLGMVVFCALSREVASSQDTTMNIPDWSLGVLE